MKKPLFLFIYVFLSINAFCQNYYEMPYVGNRSKLTKLNSREMAEFIADNSIRQVFDIPKSGEKEHYGFFSEDEGEVLFAHDIYAKLKGIYREDIPDENGNVRLTVYRVMYDFCRTTKLNLNESDKTRRRCYGQVIYVPSNGKWIQYEKQIYYGDEFWKGSQRTVGVEAKNVQFRICGDNLFAFYTRLAVIHDSVVKTDKMSENIICRTKLDNIMDKIKICEVKTGFPLIDKANPFKYSVQNAYDGDPATSYVEDSKDDLFEIDMDFMNYQSEYKDSTVTEMKLINGYASNERMYKASNRIKDVQYAWENDSDKVIYSCTDNTMGFQNFYNTDDVKGWVWLEIQSVYKGEKYNNTPLAELDVKWGKNGWLFGTPAK